MVEKVKLAAERALALVDAKKSEKIALEQATPAYLKMQMERIRDGLFDLNPKKKYYWIGYCIGCLYASGLYSFAEVNQIKRDFFDDPKLDPNPLPLES